MVNGGLSSRELLKLVNNEEEFHESAATSGNSPTSGAN